MIAQPPQAGSVLSTVKAAARRYAVAPRRGGASLDRACARSQSNARPGRTSGAQPNQQATIRRSITLPVSASLRPILILNSFRSGTAPKLLFKWIGTHIRQTAAPPRQSHWNSGAREVSGPPPLNPSIWYLFLNCAMQVSIRTACTLHILHTIKRASRRTTAGTRYTRQLLCDSPGWTPIRK